MNKTYRIQLPRNKEAQNIKTNIKDGTIEVEVELQEKWEPRDGDVVAWKDKDDDGKPAISIYKERSKGYATVYATGGITYSLYATFAMNIIRPATEDEKQLLFDALAKEGKTWDAERKQVVDLPRWRAENGEEHFMVIISSSDVEIFEYEKTDGYNLRSISVLKENRFKTLQAAEKVAEQIREIFKNSKAE